MLLQGGFERAQLGIDATERGELGDHQRIVTLAEAVQVENQSAEVAIGKLASLAQEAHAAANTPARAEAGWAGAARV
jgi:hypothetical protein